MIIENMPENEYHAHDSISKTGLWTLYKKTPYHFFYGEKKETNAMRFGSAAHTAVLEPIKFETRYVRGADNRRGNQWKDICAEAEAQGKTALTYEEYDDALRLRDVVQKHALIQKITAGQTLVEHSAFWEDDGITVRCRPDLVNPSLKIMADLKSTTDASAWKFAQRATDFGYHVQESVYTHGWQKAGGCQIDAFVFITVESEPPFAHVIYELEPSAAQEGWLVYEKALELYKKCKAENKWPSYGEGIVPLDIKKYAYQLTNQGE